MTKELHVTFKGDALDIIDLMAKLMRKGERGDVVKDALKFYQKCVAVSKGEKVIVRPESSTKGKIFAFPFKKEVQAEHGEGICLVDGCKVCK